jgi:alginate O-acetyltransferase complex protein AlgJ
VEDLVLAKKLISRDGLDWDSFMQRAVLEDPNESEPGSGKPSPIEVLLDFANQVEARGVDFIYVPIPDKIEVYPEDFVEGPVPSNGIVTPNSRRFLATLLEDGIEVVDLYPVFRANRDRGCYLYLADHHFSPAGARLAAEAVCERLRRYELPRRQSISSAGIFDAVPVDPAIPKSLRWRWEKFSFPNGTPYEDVADSPVLIVGDSNLMLANCFPEHGACFAEKGGGFSACLAAKLGFPLSLYAVPQFTPMLLSRGPKGLLRGRRALVMVHTIVQWNEGRANLRLAELPSDW